MILETSNLTKQFDGKGGFKDISLSLREGEVFCFLGKNGAGKSTFIRTVLGILKPTEGHAVMDGYSIGTVDSRMRVGYLPEMFQFHGWLTGYELLYSTALIYSMDPSKIPGRIKEVVSLVGMSGHEGKKLKDYSKGMKQRIGIAAAVISSPKLVFLDEPTSALDPVGRMHVRHIINHLKEIGTTVFLNTHLLSEVELVADRVAIIDDGEIKQTGTISDLVSSPLVVTAKNMSDSCRESLLLFDRNMESDGDSLTLNIKSDSDIPEIAGIIVSSGAKLYGIKRKDNILEELFLKVVGEEDSR